MSAPRDAENLGPLALPVLVRAWLRGSPTLRARARQVLEDGHRADPALLAAIESTLGRGEGGISLGISEEPSSPDPLEAP
jgi:hypothetical protein